MEMPMDIASSISPTTSGAFPRLVGEPLRRSRHPSRLACMHGRAAVRRNPVRGAVRECQGGPERAGDKLEVHWSGPNAAGDFVSIDAAGSPDTTYGPYAYPSAGNPLKVEAPDQPGRYEVRYHSGSSGSRFSRRPRWR